jgi:hypothetical protein
MTAVRRRRRGLIREDLDYFPGVPGKDVPELELT